MSLLESISPTAGALFNMDALANSQHWIKDQFPPDNTTVLVRLDDRNRFIEIAVRFWGKWRQGTGLRPIRKPVLGWMHLETAAAILDGRGYQSQTPNPKTHHVPPRH